jgi:hypothetical protein
MENNENLVLETEKVETTTEETPQVKTYTQEEVDAIVGKRLARKEARIRKEYDRKYGELEEVLKVGTGKDDVGEITDTFRGFYEKKGVQFAKKPSYTDDDIKVLAQAEADSIIRAGFEDVVEEVDRLSDIGVENMTAREKAVFKVLAEHRQGAERAKELSSIGVTEDVYNSDDFKSFASKFNPTIPVKDVFDIYKKTQPQKEYKTMGSMKNSPNEVNTIKDYYSPEEARKFTVKDFEKSPELYKRVVESSYKWK